MSLYTCLICACVIEHSFKKCNLNLSNDLADAPWGTIDAFDDIDDKWDYWKTLFLDIVSKHAPMIKVRQE